MSASVGLGIDRYYAVSNEESKQSSQNSDESLSVRGRSVRVS